MTDTKNFKRNKQLMEELIRYLCKNDLFHDVNIYTNGHKYSSDKGPSSEECSTYGHIYYDHGDWDVESQIEYNNPETITMTFEGPLYYAYNGYTDDGYRTEDDIQNIMAKYGLYAEQGYAWSLAAYE